MLINDIPRLCPQFGEAGQPPSYQGLSDRAEDKRAGLICPKGLESRSAALVIDVQSFQGMSREDALAFSKALGQQLTEFRQRGVKPVWVAIAAGGSKLLQPLVDDRQDAPVRDLLVLEEMGFTGHLPASAHSDVYAAFINEYGPRDNEVVYRKPSMSALVTPRDTQERDRILEWSGVKLHAQRSDRDHPETRYIHDGEQDKTFAGLFPEATTLHDYLASQDITDTFILGAVSKYCVTETAISSATKGYNTRILPDLTLSWLYPDGDAGRGKGRLVWAGFDHQDLIEKAIATAINDSARAFSADQKAQIEAIWISPLSKKNAPGISGGAPHVPFSVPQ